MQFSDVDWPNFGLVLASLFLFGCLYAALVRFMARRLVEGQTAWQVVIGVAVTCGTAGLIIGIQAVLILAACFVASGLPMIVEYVSRVESDRRADHEAAKRHGKDLL